MKKILLYQHGSSYNHGCEALVRTVSQEVLENIPDSEVYLSSFHPEEDEIFDIPKVSKVIKNKHWCRHFTPGWFLNRCCPKLLKIHFLSKHFGVFRDNVKLAKKMDACIAIGGDNYCYNKGKSDWATNLEMKKRCHKMMLWGCSVEPDDLPGELADHLRVYDAITVRESISYEAMVACGLGDRTHLVADPAFLLEPVKVEFPEGWREGQMVGINLSPLILNFTEDKETVIRSVYSLIDHILNATEMNVVLVPHVRIYNGDDMDTLRPIYEKYKDTGRVLLIDDYTLNVQQLKGYISACRFFIGARTHSIVAAYSTGVPSLALGYSVKAKGIARDIFGSEDGLVLPVQTFNDAESTVRGFEYLVEHEAELREKLCEVMPGYKEKAKLSGEIFKKMMET